jgi:hypothetical protein
MLPSVFTAQLLNQPDPTDENVPAGGVDWVKPLSPQQTMVLSVLMPQA